nr:hypothetical protein [Tanacetum cinerariifolium]
MMVGMALLCCDKGGIVTLNIVTADTNFIECGGKGPTVVPVGASYGPLTSGIYEFDLNFAVLEDMDYYRDEGMGDVIFGEPFLREVKTKARRFNGMITIYNDNESVTYQMVRSHSRFKHHTNEQCNKIPPLLKDLAAKKSTKLVKYLQSGNLEVLES